MDLECFLVRRRMEQYSHLLEGRAHLSAELLGIKIFFKKRLYQSQEAVFRY